MYEKNVNQPDIGATSISALIISGFSFNFSATATNDLQFGLVIFQRSDSYQCNDNIEKGKPAAATSKSRSYSLLFFFLATPRGLFPVLMFCVEDDDNDDGNDDDNTYNDDDDDDDDDDGGGGGTVESCKY